MGKFPNKDKLAVTTEVLTKMLLMKCNANKAYHRLDKKYLSNLKPNLWLMRAEIIKNKNIIIYI